MKKKERGFLEIVLIHIPHSSLSLPNEFLERIMVSLEEIEKENVFVSDYLIDKFAPDDFKNVMKADFSRLFCDVERFKNDSLEEMSKYGMGVIYEKSYLGKEFIKVDQNYKNKVISNYYDPYHKMLDDKVAENLKKFNRCYIINLHSFSEQFVNEVLKLDNLPDICLGYDLMNCDYNLLDITKKHFKRYGYRVMENYPYQGSIIPNKYYGLEDSSVFSLMIEINKNLYLSENRVLVEDKYLKLKECMDEYYEIISSYTLENR